MLRQRLCIKVAASAALLAVSVFSAAQTTRTYTRVRTFTAHPIAVNSTLDVFPQIQSNPPFNPQPVADNDGPPVHGNPGPRNNLTAGGLLPGPVGQVGRSFFPGPVDGRWEPADNQMAVGTGHIVCIVNSTIAFFTKDGTMLFQQFIDGPSGFFGSVAQSGFVFDPKAFYDSLSGRYIVLADDGASTSVSNILVAVSATGNPNGTWYKYRFNSLDGGSWLDYPGFGFNKDAIIITGNLFSGSAGGVEAIVVPKAPMLTGGTVTASVINAPANFTLQPARTVDGAIDKIYGAASVFPSGNVLQIFAFTNLTNNPVLKEIDLPVPAYTSPPTANSMGNAIDSDDDRLFVAQYRNGQLLTSHTIAASGNCACRWYDINVNSWPASGTPSLKQSGTIAQAGVDLLYPAINMNAFEDISVYFSRMSASIPTDLDYCGRKVTDPLGQIGQPVRLFRATQGGYGGRWGDYNANEVDPTDDATFWGFSMAVAGNAYSTQVNSWTISTGNTGTSVFPTSVSTLIGSYIIGDPSSLAASDGIDYQIGSAGITQFGQAAGAGVTFTIPQNSTSIVIDLEANSSGEPTGTNMVWLKNQFTGNYDLIGAVPMNAIGNGDQIIRVRASDVPKYIGGGGEVDMIIRGHVPIRPFNNQQPVPFTYKLDLLELIVR